MFVGESTPAIRSPNESNKKMLYTKELKQAQVGNRMATLGMLSKHMLGKREGSFSRP